MRKPPRNDAFRAMPDWLQPGHALRHKARRRGRIGSVLLLFALFVVSALVAARLDPLPPRFTGNGHAADGDSLRIGADRIRLVGLDAPELDQVCWRTDGSNWPCGRAAREEMARLLRGDRIDCQPEGEDRYGRILARCTTGGRDLGAAIVTAGLAISTGGYGREEAAARSARRGIWDGRFTDPRTWREEGQSDDPGIGLLEQAWTWFRELTGARTLR